MSENALAAVKAVAGDDDGSFGEGGGEPVDELPSKLGPGFVEGAVGAADGRLAALGLFWGGRLLRFLFGRCAGSAGAVVGYLGFGVSLEIAVEAKADGQSEDFGGGPDGTGDDQGEDDPVVSPTDELESFAG